jgi:hypothetical protein
MTGQYSLQYNFHEVSYQVLRETSGHVFAR